MMRNSGDISMEEAFRLANSETGQQLFRLLQSQDATAVDRAMAQAAAGDPAAAKQALSGLLTSPEVLAMLERIRRGSDG